MKLAGITPLDNDMVERHKAQELAAAPKPHPLRHLIYAYHWAIDRVLWNMFGVGQYREICFGPAQWKTKTARKVSRGNGQWDWYELAPEKIEKTWNRALKAVPFGHIEVDELVQDFKVIDPVSYLAVDGKRIALAIWKNWDVIAIAKQED